MPKMEGIAAEVGQKLKSAIKAKLMEMGAYVDDELSNYVMVMVTNRRSKADMDRELQLFLGANTTAFTTWLQSVFAKLEQVTVTGSGIEGSKKKGGDKKKKSKKSGRSSSDSEDDKRSKKKRKTSTSDVKSRETKKHKQTKTLLPSDSKESLFDDSATDNSVSTDTKKLNTNVETVLEKKEDNSNVERKPHQDITNSIDEDDFLNIREDFGSGFLSDESAEGNTKMKPTAKPTEPTVKTTSLKTEPAEKRIMTGVVIDRRYMQVKPVKTNITVPAKETVIIKRSNESVKTESSEPDRAASDTAKKIETDDKNVAKPSRKLLIQDRKLHPQTSTPVRSKSRSASPPPRGKLKATSGSVYRNKPNKSQSRSPDSHSRSRSRSRSRTVRGQRDLDSPIRSSLKRGIASRLRSPSPLLTKKRDRSPSLVDARELINRKRALTHGKRMMSIRRNADSSEDDDMDAIKRTKSNLVRQKNRETTKEDVNLVDEDDDDDCNIVEEGKSYNKYEKFIVSKRDGKRSILVRPTAGIRRTVYAEENGTDKAANNDGDVKINEDGKSKKNDNAKLRKSVMNQIVKHIKDDQTVAATKVAVTTTAPMTTTSTTVVSTKGTTRMKPSGTQSATNTLIRKAVADAHRSSKEDTKKKDLHENRVASAKEKSNDQVEEIVVDDDSDSKRNDSGNASDERIDDDCDYISSPELREDEHNSKDEPNHNHKDTLMENAEEYDPSQNIPQFVVTLTGLDPKTYPQEDMDLDLVEKDLEDARLRPKIAERCKYFPNCLAGDQCLYHHPVIPCKLFPNCKYGNLCLYIHPKCKFDSLCTRYDCTYMHTSPRIAAPIAPRHTPLPAMNTTATPCKYYYNCTNPVCPFLHPKLCRFDRFCTNKMCTFSHTSRTHLSGFPKDKLKWNRKDFESKADNAESKIESNETIVENY